LSSWRDDAKKRAAAEAVKNIRDGDVVGLGSGSTAAYAIREIGKRVQDEGLTIKGVATSSEAERIAMAEGIDLTSLDSVEQLDIAVDGADQVDRDLNLIKGLGGALAREKIVDDLTKCLIIVVDETKLSDRLGVNMPVPVEVLPFALNPVTSRLKKMGGRPVLRMREDGEIMVTDNHNYILDTYFGTIENPEEMREKLKLIAGVIENGLFIDMTDKLYVGCKKGIKIMERR
jgi:ribose 5-phosphate isomerase A